VRWDGGYVEGDTISQYYDNLIGKLIVWAPDRDRAIQRMLRALGEFEVGGVQTTIAAHVPLVAHADFAAIAHSTKWVETEIDPAVFVTGEPLPDTADSPSDPLVARTMPVEVNGKRFSVTVWTPDAPPQSSGVGAPAARARPKVARSSAGGGSGSGVVAAPMQGTIVKVLVAAGDAVEVGQSLVVLEAMKMENNITAEKGGTVQEVRVEAGQSVGTGDVLVVIA